MNILSNFFEKHFTKLLAFVIISWYHIIIATINPKEYTMKKFCKSASARSAIYFTIATIIFCLLVLFGNSGADQISLDPKRVICIYPFCLLFAIANTLVTYKNLDGALRWILHATLTVCGAFLFLILPAEFGAGSSNLMGFALILFIYILSVIIYALINRRVKSAIAEDRQLSDISKKSNKK